MYNNYVLTNPTSFLIIFSKIFVLLPEILQQIKNELVNGVVKKGHPFRYFTLTTIAEDIPKARTVVLRKMNIGFELVFYTDKRSKKVEELINNEKASALFYHPKKLLQISLIGLATLEKNDEILKDLWESIPDNSKKDYTTKLSPGTSIKNPDMVEYQEKNNFCVIKIKVTEIEFLQLKRPNHLRAKFKLENDKWQGQFLVP